MSRIIHEDLEIGVINLELLQKAVKDQGPKGEAGRLATLNGITIDDVEVIRLEFLNILKIDHLWMMTSLVKLQIGNNIIEQIENLEQLVNLKELDLSFNNIAVIENLDALVKLEILTLFSNRITKLENLEQLVNLMIFSVGNNLIEDWDNILYLRKFHPLRSLNFAGNPCFEKPNCREYIIAFLPQLVYYQYKMVTKQETEEARQVFLKPLEKIEDEDAKMNAIKQAEEKVAAEVEFYSVAFIEYLNEDQLFKSLFDKDEFGQLLLLTGADARNIYYEYEKQFALLVAELFKLGQEQHEIRQEELKQFYNCVNTAKYDSQSKSQKVTESFLDRKTEIFAEIRKLFEVMEEAEDEKLENAVERMQTLNEDFHELCQRTWPELMGLELTLFEQIEEINDSFERNLYDIVSVFVELAQGVFVQCRNLEISFNQQLAEISTQYLNNLIVNTDMTVMPDLSHIMVDKEVLNNALSASHDIHMQLIDSREDRLVTRIRAWASGLCGNLQKDEITRDRSTVMEINHFLDIQQEEFQEIQPMPMGSVRSTSYVGV